MGRLRSDYEYPLFRGITEEVVDLFGVDDVYLFRFSAADNISIKDPLYDEPTTDVAYKKFKIKALYQDYADDVSASDSGEEIETEARLYISKNHLFKARVPADKFGEYVSEGDVVALHYKGNVIQFDIIQVDRDGFVNDSDSFTGYTCDLKRREKYLPERKSGD